MSTGTDLPARVSDAIVRGVAFLASHQLPTGELEVRTWRPAAPEPVRDPSVFGTALIVAALREVPRTESLRNRACDFLESHMEPHGVWRHWTRGHPEFHYVPPDLDDTAVCCMALAQNGRRVPDNRRLLLSNRDARGLFFSWISLRSRWVRNLAYWRISVRHLLLHPFASTAFYSITPSERRDVDAVVNANVLAYLGASRETEPILELILGVLRERRETSCDKWYDDPFVIWYFFSRALRVAGCDARDLLLERLRSTDPACALDRALSMSVKLDWSESVGVEEVREILEAQLTSGGWPLAAVYKGRRVRWGSEELTTAVCVEALSRWNAREHS